MVELNLNQAYIHVLLDRIIWLIYRIETLLDWIHGLESATSRIEQLWFSDNVGGASVFRHLYNYCFTFIWFSGLTKVGQRWNSLILHNPSLVMLIIDCVALAKQGDNRFGNIHPSVCLFVCLYAPSCLYCLTYDLDFWHGGQSRLGLKVRV